MSAYTIEGVWNAALNVVTAIRLGQNVEKAEDDLVKAVGLWEEWQCGLKELEAAEGRRHE